MQQQPLESTVGCLWVMGEKECGFELRPWTGLSESFSTACSAALQWREDRNSLILFKMRQFQLRLCRELMFCRQSSLSTSLGIEGSRELAARLSSPVMIGQWILDLRRGCSCIWTCSGHFLLLFFKSFFSERSEWKGDSNCCCMEGIHALLLAVCYCTWLWDAVIQEGLGPISYSLVLSPTLILFIQ